MLLPSSSRGGVSLSPSELHGSSLPPVPELSFAVEATAVDDLEAKAGVFDLDVKGKEP